MQKKMYVLGVAVVLTIVLMMSFGPSVTFAKGSDSFTSSPVNIASLQKTCAQLLIHLNGAQHSISCTEVRTSAGKVQPDLFRDGCGNLGNTITIINNDFQNEVCFSGLGYLGVQIYQVDEVLTTVVSVWMRFYPPGVFCSLNDGDTTNFGGSEITQLDAGSTGGYQHC